MKIQIYIQRILVGTKGDVEFNGQVIENIWTNTNFIIEFSGLQNSQMPNPGDIYEINFERPFWATDTLTIVTRAPHEVDLSNHNLDMEKIKVVPNPYIGTNLLEESIYSSNFNQRRKKFR